MPFFQCGQSLDLCEEIFWKKNPHESCSPSKMAVVDTYDVVHVVDIVGREIHINPWSCLPIHPQWPKQNLPRLDLASWISFENLAKRFFICNAIKISFERDFFILICTMQSMNFLLLRSLSKTWETDFLFLFERQSMNFVLLRSLSKTFGRVFFYFTCSAINLRSHVLDLFQKLGKQIGTTNKFLSKTPPHACNHK